MAHAHQPYWLWAGSISSASGLALVGVAGALDAARTHFALWASPVMIAAYVALGVALLCFGCAIRDIPFPLALPTSQQPATQSAKPLTDPAPATGRSHIRTSATVPYASQYSLEERDFVHEAPKDLRAIFKAHKPIEARKLAESYYYRWLRVRGPFGDIGGWVEPMSSAFAFFANLNDPGVGMIFNDENVYNERLSTLKKGNIITVIGQIELIDQSIVVITNCELESVAL